MFMWDFAINAVLGDLLDWIYGQAVNVLSEFFGIMGNMGAELFELESVQAVVLFFSYLAWALYLTGLVVAVFETALECQSGRGSIRDTGLNAIKGFMAVNLFNVAPIEMYKLCISLQVNLVAGITGSDKSFGEMAAGLMEPLSGTTPAEFLEAGMFGGIQGITSPVLMIILLIMVGYSIVKVFFANLKRGGILLIEIAVGSLYLFSVPRGYIDGFTGWCKQIIGICFTAFLQAVILLAGLMVLKTNGLLGVGMMLSSTEVPRIAGQFGLDTSTKANLMGTVHAAQSVVSLTRTIIAKAP